MKLNFKDKSWIENFAKKMKINYKFDPTIAPRNLGRTIFPPDLLWPDKLQP